MKYMIKGLDKNDLKLSFKHIYFNRTKKKIENQKHFESLILMYRHLYNYFPRYIFCVKSCKK